MSLPHAPGDVVGTTNRHTPRLDPRGLALGRPHPVFPRLAGREHPYTFVRALRWGCAAFASLALGAVLVEVLR